MATIHVDGKSYEVEGSDNLLQACLSLGLTSLFLLAPGARFRRRLPPVRGQHVRQRRTTAGRIVMSCMTPSTDNTYISIDDEEAKANSARVVVEWLMTNHPHDCPVCEEGGHCHLQDMTVMTQSPAKRRYRFNKRTHHNQDLGPFINHEMNRCIACYRCVRYYKDYADGSDLGVFGAHDSVYFGRVRRLLESEFSGNLTEVCPTGVFTDKHTLRSLQPQVGHAVWPQHLPAVLGRLQHQRRRTLRRIAPHREPLQRRGESLFPVRSRALRLRLRESLETDLYRHAPAVRVDAALAASKLVVIDHQRTPTAEHADVLLSAASFAEGDGTVVNNEGRAQRFFQVFDATYYRPDANIHESWRWLRGVQTSRDGQPVDWDQLDHATRACADVFPLLAGIVDAAPVAGFRIKGLKIARSPRRWSGRTSLRANISVHEPRAPQDQDTALAFSMEGYSGPNEASALVPFAWAPGWNSPQAWNKFQDEVGGHLRAGDSGVRLLEAGNALGYATPASAPRSERTLVPLYHIFGSEELSARADVTESRIPAPYVALNAADAAALGLRAGQTISLRVGNDVLTLPLSIVELANNTVGLPVGLPGMPFVAAGSSVMVGGAA
jgi:NADH dehydrogenase/NADH:ubiquinone oxidoreductase subunit G